MQDYFYTVADLIGSRLQGQEIYTCVFTGETSDFVRFNRAKVRQAGRVTQYSLSLDLSEGRRHATAALTLAGDLNLDSARIERLVKKLREIRVQTPEDPFLLYATEVCSSEQVYPDELLTGPEMAGQILTAARSYDLVGIHASGTAYTGFANSFGQRNWYCRSSFNLDWSLYLHTDKAVKARYAGFHWDANEFTVRLEQAAEQLQTLARPAYNLQPGLYRAYLAPAAFEDIMDLLGWGGFGLRDHRTGNTPLLRMIESGDRLSSQLTVTENTAAGVAPNFESAGFIRPPQVTMIEAGNYKTCLVSPRSAAEYDVPSNGADSHEAPLSLDVAPGDLAQSNILEALDTGLYIGNLWYLNYSDRNAARLTGMTRFATFWVEDGRIKAPVNAMRFDETIYNLLGDSLLGLTREREMLLDPGSYGGRSKRSVRLPGILVSDMQFTL